MIRRLIARLLHLPICRDCGKLTPEGRCWHTGRQRHPGAIACERCSRTVKRPMDGELRD